MGLSQSLLSTFFSVKANIHPIKNIHQNTGTYWQIMHIPIIFKKGLNLRHFKQNMQVSAELNKAATFCYSFVGYCA